MTQEQFEALKLYISSVVAEMIEEAFGRDSGGEYLTRYEAEQELKNLLVKRD